MDLNLLELVLLILPAYVANSLPVVFGGGKTIDELVKTKNAFGKSKTVQGFTAGVAFGALSGVIIAVAFNGVYLPELELGKKIVLATVLSFGALTGDLLGSFLKRRLGMPAGHPSPVIDQLSFLAIALLFGFLAFPQVLQKVWWQGLLALAVLTYALHLFFNILAHKLALKKVPW